MNILIAYSTLLGEAERISRDLYEQIRIELKEHTFQISNVEDLTPSQIHDHDVTIIIASTTGDGDLNPDAEEFIKKIHNDSADFNGDTFALFGIGETFYPHFCGAIDTIEKELKIRHATIVGDIKKEEIYGNENIDKTLYNWAKEVIASIN